jgi:hypothetical protein
LLSAPVERCLASSFARPSEDKCEADCATKRAGIVSATVTFSSTISAAPSALIAF